MPQTPAQLVTVDGGAPHWIILRTPIRFAGSTDIAPGSLIIIPFGWFGDRLLMPVQWLGWAFAALAITAAPLLPAQAGKSPDPKPKDYAAVPSSRM
mgnify:CR=1 FL=1